MLKFRLADHSIQLNLAIFGWTVSGQNPATQSEKIVMTLSERMSDLFSRMAVAPRRDFSRTGASALHQHLPDGIGWIPHPFLENPA